MATSTILIKIEALNQATKNIAPVTKELNNLNQASKTTGAGLDNASKKAKAAGSAFDNLGLKMQTAGGKMSVLGQRLSYSVSLPLVMFGKTAIDTAQTVEEAWVRFDKVFGGTADSMERLRGVGAELSSKFGKPVEEVADIMGEFNKAGIDSEEMIAKLSEKALETSILFDTDVTTAFDGVKSIMLGFGLSVEDTEKALASLNRIADTTASSEAELLTSMEKAGGTARSYGVSIEELAAATSVLQQNNISGAIAGNSLKTVMIKLNSVTGQAESNMAKFGVNMKSSEYRTLSFDEKLKVFAKTQNEIFASGNKDKIAEWHDAIQSVFGIYQESKANILIEDVAKAMDDSSDTISTYAKALNDSADSIQNLKIWNDQLKTVMESEPQNVKVAEQVYRNQVAILGNELLPIKIKLLTAVTDLIEKFNALDPATKELYVKFGLVLVVAGPLLSLFGNLVTVIGGIGSAINVGTNAITLFSKGILPLISNIGLATAGSTALSTIMRGGLLAGVTAVTVYIAAKAIQAFQDLNAELDTMQNQYDQNIKKLDVYKGKLDSLSTESANEQFKNATVAAEDANKALKVTIDRYNGISGAIRAVGDAFSDVWDKVKKLDKDDSGQIGFGELFNYFRKKFNNGGVAGYNSGGVVYAQNGFLPKGRDTIPAMLSPGEMVLNKTQQSNLFDMLLGRLQPQTATAGVTVEINVGNMIASRGEQREFARKIQELLQENLAFK